MSNSVKKWYALFTKPGCEKKVGNLLTRRDIENYCPLKRQWNGRKKLVLEPLFNSYVFIKIMEAEMQHIRLTDNVMNFVYWLQKPVVIKDEEIEMMKQFVNEYVNVRLEKIPFNANGVATGTGALLNENMIQMTFVDNDFIQMALPSLGYILMAEVKGILNGEIITPSPHPHSEADKYRYAI